MAGVTLRDATRNQATYDYLIKKLLLGQYKTRRKDYTNISGAEETVVVGTVMGVVTASKEMVPCIAAAVDGSQEPVTILLEELTAIAIAGAQDNVLTVYNAEVDRAQVVFHNGADTLATSVTDAGGNTKTMEDFLIQNGNYEFLTTKDSSEFDN